MTNANPDLHTPAEQLPITLFDAVVLAVRTDDGTISLAIRDVCQALAIDFSTQLRRIRNQAVLVEGLARLDIPIPPHGKAARRQCIRELPRPLAIAVGVADENVRHDQGEVR